MRAYSPVIHYKRPFSHRNQTGLTVGAPEALVVATRATRGRVRKVSTSKGCWVLEGSLTLSS